MNKYILCALDRKNRTTEELRINAAGAEAAYDCSNYAYAADYAADAAYDDVAGADYDGKVEYWLNRYFKITGEERCDYEKAIKDIKTNKEKGERIMKESETLSDVTKALKAVLSDLDKIANDSSNRAARFGSQVAQAKYDEAIAKEELAVADTISSGIKGILGI